MERTASPDAIRAAYIALMKRVHPDAAGTRGRQGEAKAKAINEAVSVLRDPRKKALYDAQLGDPPKPATRRAPPKPNTKAGAAAVRASEQRAYVRAYPLARERRDGRKAASALGLLSVVAAAAFMLQDEWVAQSGGRWSIGASAEASPAGARDEPPRILEIDVVDAVADVNWIFAYGASGDAMRYSRHCFGELADYPNFRLFDRCVAFDLAWQYRLAAGKGPAAVQQFFSVSALSERHSAAMGRLPDRVSTRARIARLDRLAVSHIAQSLGLGAETRLTDRALLSRAASEGAN